MMIRFSSLLLLWAMTLCASCQNREASDAEKTLARSSYESARNGDKAAFQKLTVMAARGNAVAQYDLGLLYDEGEGVTKDVVQAVGWFRKAAEQGSAVAQTHCGVMYEGGLGVPKDESTAVEWYRKAAEQGFADAQYYLGFEYKYGTGVPEDLATAYMWFNLAAAQGKNAAIAAREELAALMSPQQIAEGQKLSREWQPKTQKSKLRQ
jgi:TPR repeat protein